MRRIALLIVISLVTGICVTAAQGAEDLQSLLRDAKAGQTVTLPEGEFRGGVTVPDGVSLRGAGYDKTVIDATGRDDGLTVNGGSGATISDLTVRGASGTNILAQGAEKLTVSRVRVTGGMLGVSLKDGRQCRIENVISDANRYGIVAAGGEGNVVVNCTMAGNTTIGLSLPSGKGTVAFNNCITESATAIVVGEQAVGLVLDHNLLFGLIIGKLKSQTARDTLGNWQYLSGYDSHSVSMPVQYPEASKGRFAAGNRLEWSLDRLVTAGWGAANLGGQAAPAEDIDGNKRPATPGLGAYEPVVQAPRPADGKLKVTSGKGMTSAGVFDSKGKLVAYLFQGLPLAKGEYPFWLPSRSYKGRKIEAGQYEVRVVESKLDWEYAGWFADTEKSDAPGANAASSIEAIAFDNAGRVLAGRTGGEQHLVVRGYDSETGKWLWSLKGNSGMRGIATASDGLFYTLRLDGATMRVSRGDPATGKVSPWGKDDYGHTVLKAGTSFNGLAALGTQLFYTDPKNNVVQVGTTQSPEPTISVEVKSPSCPAADAKVGVVWVISEGDKLVAISSEGKIVAQAQPVPKPISLAASDGRLAVASEQTGKVHLFDASDPSKLKPLSTLGSGDGPGGPVVSERFLFKDGTTLVHLAMGPKQELAVGEDLGRIQVFTRDGKLKWSSFSTGGWGTITSKVTPGRVLGGFMIALDSETRTWRPELFLTSLKGGHMVGDFQIEGQTFVAMNEPREGISFMRLTPDKFESAGGIIRPYGTKEPWTYRVDSNGDGVVNSKDAVVETMTDEKGQPVVKVGLFNSRFCDVQANGDLTSASSDGWLTVWRCAGLDKQGNPIYRYADRKPVPSDKADLVSPYDFVQTGGGGCAAHMPRPNDGWLCISGCSGNPTGTWINTGGVDLVAVDSDGVVDWVHPFAPYGHMVGSLVHADGLYIAALGETYDFIAMNSDGLRVQGFSFPQRANYQGHWVDHPDTVGAFVDKAGRANVVTCDYVNGRNQWFILTGKDIREGKFAIEVSKETAASLEALPAQKLDMSARKPATPVVRIARLKEPLTIDGDMQKWRDLEITPQIITPESSAGIEGGPRDCSAIVRLAYHGQDMYLQVIRFDDVITTHQPRSRAYQQDTVEMCVNGILEGIKFNISMTTDAGAVNQVDGRRLPAHTLDKKDSPLVINMLDDAKTVSERKLIESIFGVDMSGCKVQVIETRIPMDAKTYAGRPEARFELKPGQKFWLGFLIDDNDVPGTDLQNFIYWPVTFGNFNPVESGAIAVFE